MTIDPPKSSMIEDKMSLWFTFCMVCNHGGHLGHLTKWFKYIKFFFFCYTSGFVRSKTSLVALDILLIYIYNTKAI